MFLFLLLENELKLHLKDKFSFHYIPFMIYQREVFHLLLKDVDFCFGFELHVIIRLDNWFWTN